MANLYRSSDDKVLAGVCAGIARALDLNATGLRWATVIVTLFFSGLPLIVYIVLWIVLKQHPTKDVVDV